MKSIKQRMLDALDSLRLQIEQESDTIRRIESDREYADGIRVKIEVRDNSK